MKNTRRQFLKNATLSSLSLSMIPGIVGASALSNQNVTGAEGIKMCDRTTQDRYGQGPFYTPNPPTLFDNQLANESEKGTRIIITGRVYDLSCEKVIPNTEVDIWHADDDGRYDNSGYNLRGKVYSNEQGYYTFETIKPGFYLNGSQFRPSHIHFRITPPGFDTLITQLYFEGDPYISNDGAASINSGNFDATNRIIPLTDNGNGVLEGTWDITINGDGQVVLGNEGLNAESGILYETYPNPFVDELKIKYGVFKSADVHLTVHDVHGNLIADLAKKQLRPEKYEAIWRPDAQLPKGHYFVALKINDLQVHYLKVVKS